MVCHYIKHTLCLIIRTYYCLACPKGPFRLEMFWEWMDGAAGIQHRLRALQEVLDERSRRLVAAAESQAIGCGGISAVANAIGISRRVIRQGIAELEGRAVLPRGTKFGVQAAHESGRRISIHHSRPTWSRFWNRRLVVIRNRLCGGPARASVTWRTCCMS